MSNKTCMSSNINSMKIIVLLGLLFLLSNCSQSIPSLMYTSKDLSYAYSNEIHINYEKLGYGDKKVVFLHGFGTSLHTWDDVKELFPVDEFTLYLIDLKGFGNSSKPEDDKYTIEDQAKIVKQFVEDINTDSLYLIGHSYGGAVALLTQISLLNEKSKTR
ncbi:MAG: alpha/beta fold hydrolase, partial [Melioribacteraceae bacterium]